MVSVGPPLLAFGIATLATLLELVTSKYPRTFFLLKRSWALYAYPVIYGVIGFGVTVGLGLFVETGTIKVEGLGLSNPWIQAIAVGLSIKAFLHLRLFSVGIGSQSFPIGVETIVQVFEPWLLRTIELHHFSMSREFLTSRANRYHDLNDVRARITANLPPTFPDQERAAFLADVGRTTTVTEAMELYLAFLGKRNFDRVFPP